MRRISETLEQAGAAATAAAAPSRARRILRIARGQPTREGAGVHLSRVIGTPEMPDLDPFLLLDEFRSDDAADYLAGFPDHPHRGFETVTYMLAGRMRHADNQGNSGLLLPGGAQWMTAGRGIIHSEMPEQEDGLLWGFQLWVNLPAREKMTAPRYQDIAPEAVPELAMAGGGRVRVIAGRLDDAEGPVRAVATEPVYLDVALPAGAAFACPVPPSHAAFVYVFEGAAASVGSGATERRVLRGELAVLGPGARADLAAAEGPVRLLLVAGRPLKEPIARHGPFVMNTAEEIRRALDDFRAGRF